MADNNNRRSGPINFNSLSNLFKECRTSSGSDNMLRLQSVSYSNENMENMRRSIFDYNIDENAKFSNSIKEKLDEIKTNSISYFNEYIKQINKNFENFKNKISSFIDSKEKKVSRVSEQGRSNKGIIKYAKQNIFKKIDNTIEICDNIINNIEQNFKLLIKFFEQNIMINNQKQTEDFLLTNYKFIEKCSIVNKFNFTELDSTKLNKIDYYNYYIKYLSQKKIVTQGIAKNYLLTKDDWQNGLRFILENFSSLEKLKLEKINNNDFRSILENIDINIKNNNNKFNLKTLDLKDFGNIDIKIDNSKLNKIEKLKIQRGTYINLLSVIKSFIVKNRNLKSLSLDYINMTDIGFRSLIISLKNNPNITNTLEYLSLEGNRITEVSNFQIDEENKIIMNNNSVLFQKLKTFILRKNGIYNFESKFLTALPELRFLDLTWNKIPTGSLMREVTKDEFQNTIVLMNDNMFITNVKNNNDIYIDYLNKRFPNFDHEFKNLNLNFTYDIESESKLENLLLLTDVVVSLINLDLSFCAINTDTLVNFFNNNPKFLSLKNLNLSYNNIKGDFFVKIMSNEEICFDNINFIELSENYFVCGNLEKIEGLTQFIEKNQNLEKIKLYNAGFVTDLINFLKEKNSRNEKFKEVFRNLKTSLIENKRDFKFETNEANPEHIQKEFVDFFIFPKP